MEIQDFKPKQPTGEPQSVPLTVASNDEVLEEWAVEQDAPVEAEVTAEKKPVLTIEGEDGKLLSPTEFVESLVELKDRAKAAGLRPIQNMVTSYINQGLSMVDGLLESLEGSKKKDK